MRLVIRAHHFPGRCFADSGGRRENVHVGLQVGRAPADVVPGDADRASWRTDIEVVERDGLRDFRGPAVQGRRGERFVYLTWGDVDGETFTMFRRAKLMLDHTPRLDEHPGEVIASVDLTDDRGGPRCARLKAPALAWDVRV